MDLSFSFNRLQEVIEGLVGKEITVYLTSGDDLTGKLTEILPDALILENHSKKLGIVWWTYIAMILEGPIEEKK